MELFEEGKANTHLTHLEELVLTQGPRGFQMARAFLLELLETLKGNSQSKVSTSVKWDGAPAIFAGINPENGKFFVGTKSIFNKVPKINYTPEDIVENHGHAPGLVDKLTKALSYLPSLGIRKILQGDFMFDDEMLEIVEIDGEPHYRFKPNTIVYAVPVDSELGREIGQSKFGIVFHTTYDSLDSGASFGADVSNLNRVPGIWFDDAFFTDDTGTVTLTDDEEKKVLGLVAEADNVNNKINYDDLPFAMLNIYINNEIKSGVFLENPAESFNGFIEWYSARVEKKVDSLKSEKGRMRAFERGEKELQSFQNNKEDILNLFRVSRLLFEAKNVFIQKYNNAVYNTKHFVEDGSGDLVASNPEGYVAVDHDGNGVKFVDRLEFSRANFMLDKSAKFQKNENLTVYWGDDGFSTTKPLQEWATNLPKTQKTDKVLYQALQNGTPLTALVASEARVKYSLAAAVNWGLQEGTRQRKTKLPTELMSTVDFTINEEAGKRVIAIYPGRFQPMGRHHFQTYQKIVDEYGLENTFIVTSDKTGPRSPLNFEQKKDIMIKHGVPAAQIVKASNPYAAKEVLENFDSDSTSVVYLVGAKDMTESPRFSNLDGVRKDGAPAYLKTFRRGEELFGFDDHGYIGVAPHVSIDVPGFGEMSGTALRKALKYADPTAFESIMGWFDEEVYNLLQGALNELSGVGGAPPGAVTSSGIAGYSLPLGMKPRYPDVAGSEKKKKRHPKNFIAEEELVNEVVDYLLGITVG